MPNKIKITTSLFAESVPATCNLLLSQDNDAEVVLCVAKALYGSNFRRRVGYLRNFFQKNRNEIVEKVILKFHL